MVTHFTREGNNVHRGRKKDEQRCTRGDLDHFPEHGFKLRSRDEMKKMKRKTRLGLVRSFASVTETNGDSGKLRASQIETWGFVIVPSGARAGKDQMGVKCEQIEIGGHCGRLEWRTGK